MTHKKAPVKPGSIILLLLYFSHVSAQPIVQVNAGTGLHMAAGAEVYLDGLVFYPGSGFPVPGEKSISRMTASSFSLNGFSIGRVYELNQPVADYEGDIALYYNQSELNGLQGSQLKLLVYDGIIWKEFDPSIHDEVNNYLKVENLHLPALQALTLGYLLTTPGYSTVCTYSQGYYGNRKGVVCMLDADGATRTSTTSLMIAAFGLNNAVQFGSAANRRFFTLFKTDISNGNIFKMLPGTGNAQVIGEDTELPYDGAFYDDPKTWGLVPIAPGGAQKGRINNMLLSQTITLWFNLRNSPSLAGIELVDDTLVTAAQAACGSETVAGDPVKFGLPHAVVEYLNGNNGYTADVNGLFRVANDVLGGVVSNLAPADVQAAVAAINLAFDGCRILLGTIPFRQKDFITKRIVSPEERADAAELEVRAFPNPFSGKFSLEVTAAEDGMAAIKFFTADGALIGQQIQYLKARVKTVIQFAGMRQSGSVLYLVETGRHRKGGIVVGQ